MLLVYKHPADASRARIQVLVGAPTGKIRLPVVQLQRNVAGRMGKVKSGVSANTMRRRSDGLEVKILAGIIVHAPETHHSQFIAQGADPAYNVFRPQGVLSLARLHLDQHLFGV